jgi:hypothetical protein
MDSEGNIYHLYNNEDADKVAEELDLVLVPIEELAKVSNLSTKERLAWRNDKLTAA